MTVTEIRIASRYRLGRQLGTGGMGRVWLGHDEILHRDVAVKEVVLPFGLGDDEREEMRLRTMREARAAARLNHPNVVQIYDVVQSEEQPWIVMEYVRSRSLLQVLKEHGPLDVEQVAGIGLAILSALDAANRVGVLHRDVKPSNVLIADDGRVVLTDFGSALVDENEGAITRTGVILGAPQYIAPERARTGESTVESDLWSLGATLYAAVEGRAPYARPTAVATLIALTTERPDPMVRAGALKPILQGLLQKNPAARMSAKEAEQRLARIADVQTTVHLRRVPSQRKAIESGPVNGNGAGTAGSGTSRTGYAPPVRDRAPGQATAAPAGAAPARAEQVDGVTDVPEPEPADAATDAPPDDAGTPLAPRFESRTANGRSRRMQLTAAAVTVGVLAAIGGAAFAADHVGRRINTPRPAATGVAPPVGATPTQRGASAPAADPDVLPAGLSWWKDSTNGFRIGYPTGWTIIERGPGSISFCEPGVPHILKAHTWNRSDADFVTAMIHDEGNAKLANYKRIRLEALPSGDGAEWEYTFTDPKMGPLHVVARGFIVTGQSYMIEWLTPPNDWQAYLGNYPKLARTFRAPQPKVPVA